MTDRPHVTWEHGGEATIMAAGADIVRLRSSVPSPPGSRITGALAGGLGTLRVKIHACKRQEDGTYVLEGRPLDLTREVRVCIEALAASS